MRILLALLTAQLLVADGTGVIASKYSSKEFALTADPAAAAWKSVPGVFATNGPKGEPVPGHHTEIRSRWTAQNLNLLFVCPYETLHLKPSPSTTEETNKLWEWDVAETFIGSDFENIKHYYEFQVSPQGEWVDLDIRRDKPLPDGGWTWNSGFAVKARLDEARKIWYGEMRIPLEKIDSRPPRAGNQLRINFYRIPNTGADKKHIAWQPTGGPSYHVPEAFGRLRMVK